MKRFDEAVVSKYLAENHKTRRVKYCRETLVTRGMLLLYPQTISVALFPFRSSYFQKKCFLKPSAASSGVENRLSLILFFMDGNRKNSLVLYGRRLIIHIFFIEHRVVWADV